MEAYFLAKKTTLDQNLFNYNERCSLLFFNESKPVCLDQYGLKVWNN